MKIIDYMLEIEKLFISLGEPAEIEKNFEILKKVKLLSKSCNIPTYRYFLSRAFGYDVFVESCVCMINRYDDENLITKFVKKYNLDENAEKRLIEMNHEYQKMMVND